MSKDTPTQSDSPPPRKPKDTLSSGEPWRYSTLASFIRDGTISPLAKAVHGALASYITESQPLAFPSLTTLCKHTGKHRETVQRAIKELETHGLIVRHKVRQSGKYFSTRYELIPHKPKGRKRHHSGKTPQRQKTASSITHIDSFISSPPALLELVRTTPQPCAPSGIIRESLHKPGCFCAECRPQYHLDRPLPKAGTPVDF